MESSFPNSLTAASNCVRLSFERNRCTSSGRSASYTNAAEEGSRDETKLQGAVNAEAPDRIRKKPRDELTILFLSMMASGACGATPAYSISQMEFKIVIWCALTTPIPIQ
jgi:hypothetical protein